MNEQLILGIDTSCDDTSVAVINQKQQIISNIVSSQIALHQPYGGVFPTVAKLAHQKNIDHCVELALKKAQCQLTEITAIAVTQGPGLAPALEVGLKKAQELAVAHSLPLIPVNHVEAHLWSSQLAPFSKKLNNATSSSRHSLSLPIFPVLSLVASGGHSEFILIEKPGKYQILGQTLDDAAGECLDKIGRLLNLGYPAGPTIEQFAKLGNPKSFPFPLPLTTHHDFNLSFSGLKTFARNLIKELELQSPDQQLSAHTIYDLCASAQTGVFRHLLYKLNKLLISLKQAEKTPSSFPLEFWLGGGVAANIEFRHQLRLLLNSHQLELKVPYKKSLCGDNAAMIGLIGLLKYQTSSNPDKNFPSLTILDRQPGQKITNW